MTSIASESVATILCTSKQTRFNIQTADHRELDIDGLNITVASAGKSGAKAKSKARSDGTEILVDAKLRLKAGQRYALIGRNGSGKSTLLKAIAEKLIPGIPEETRVSLLQQTSVSDADSDTRPGDGVADTGESSGGRSVLEHVIEQATAKSDVEQEIRALSEGINSTDPYGPVHAVRALRHDRNQKRLFREDKNARLRSGDRGLAARKVLKAFGKTVAESQKLMEQPQGEISAEALKNETQEALDMLADLQLQVEPSRVAEIESKAKRILTGLGFSEAYMSKPVSSLSGGWRMRTALSVSLLQETDVLILDEPTNFLDLLGIIWLQRHLESLQDVDGAPTLILVSHDRDFITLCTDLLILKEKGLTYFHGDLPTYEASQSERKLWLTKMKDAQDKQKAHIQQSISNNMKAGKANDDQNKLRQAKSRQKKLDDRWGLQVSAKGGRFKLNRDLVGYHLTARDEIDVPQDERPVSFVLPEPPDLRFPGPLISVENATFRYPVKTKTKTAVPIVLQAINLSVHMGDRIGILGLNGAGKSTLVKLLVEEAKPTTGTVTTHPRLKLGYYSQHAVESLQEKGRANPSMTALSLLTEEVAGELDEGQLRGVLGSLGLPGRIASDVPLGKLSGGQLVRCELARLLWRRPHCLILDEVTTHLDYETVTAIRESLRDWEGAVILVSHDRWFMRGAVEGLVEDSDSEEGDDDEDAVPRRRLVYKLRAGVLTRLEGGVTEFEEGVAKRVNRLLNM
ncbi:Putative AAA+ ATPase domain, P-loop containing nucleoside triphosphate hydrolase [Colletotrichum destructivum]|uniref:AAA+ ATPase domain, P-loop containing nucleoside triphosphate hydrolase n=1 Tax=Colletotrichum destructivum TaxID=34406 RepID=A0AAX4IJL3_9PEZI|nr:Putative AAA+ ATPase domain, P-loop containing nucleoside triphosphate hydrolase [Colletotrichum destructivum]